MTNSGDIEQLGTAEHDDSGTRMKGASGKESELQLRRDQVDQLQIAMAERKKPWYLQGTILLSLMALLVSAVTAIYTLTRQHYEDIRSKKDELRGTLMALIDLRDDFDNRVRLITDQRSQEAAGILLNIKKDIYLEAAEFLVTQIPNHVSSPEYGVLAMEQSSNSDFSQAEYYYLKAVDASRTVLQKVYAVRALARLYFVDNPLRDFQKGRNYYRESVEISGNPTDPYSIATLGDTYERWGLDELFNGFRKEGDQKIELARKYYLMLPTDHRRDQILGLLDNNALQARRQGSKAKR